MSTGKTKFLYCNMNSSLYRDASSIELFLKLTSIIKKHHHLFLPSYPSIVPVTLTSLILTCKSFRFTD